MFQVAPGRCHSLEDPQVVMEADQVLHIDTELEDDTVNPIPVFKAPAKPQPFQLDETPYINYVARKVQYVYKFRIDMVSLD